MATAPRPECDIHNGIDGVKADIYAADLTPQMGGKLSREISSALRTLFPNAKNGVTVTVHRHGGINNIVLESRLCPTCDLMVVAELCTLVNALLYYATLGLLR